MYVYTFYTFYYFLSSHLGLSSFCSLSLNFLRRLKKTKQKNTACIYLERLLRKVVQGHFCVSARTQIETWLIITGTLCCHLYNTVIFISQRPYTSASVKCTALVQHTSSGTLDQRAEQELIWMRLCRLKIKDLVMKRVYCQSPAQMSPRDHAMYREGGRGWCLLWCAAHP